MTVTLCPLQKIRATVDTTERKQLMMDLNVSRTLHCPYTITFYGALFREGDVWICMELMDKSLSQLYKLVYDQLKLRIPEPVLGKMIEAVSAACIDKVPPVLTVGLVLPDCEGTSLPQVPTEGSPQRYEAPPSPHPHQKPLPFHVYY